MKSSVGDAVLAPAEKGAPDGRVQGGAVEIFIHGSERVVLGLVRGGCPRGETGNKLDGIGDDVAIRAVVADGDGGGGSGFRSDG